ncbi:retrotransposon Gag-like protein 3 [Saccopteryx bilineata]|uniref:retrotransposon Gag-like protein 3 n=1 Tax=Saccopteryx bilineata TaxID=59482 RepID=UPI00338E863D
MVEDLAASYIALKLENEILQAQMQRLMEENAALQAQIPELQKSQAAKEDEPLQKPTAAQEPPKSSEPLNSPEFEEPQKSREPQELPAWGTLASQEPQVNPMVQETQKLLKSPTAPEFLEPSGTKELEKPLMALKAHKVPEVKQAQEPPDTKDTPEAQNSEFQDLPNAQELQEIPECQETLTYLEPLEVWAPSEPLGPSDAQEFLQPSISLEGLIAVETSATSEFSQSPSGLEAEAFPLEYPLGFHGSTQKLPEFLVQLNSHIRVRRDLYPTEATLVSFVGDCFQTFLDIPSPHLEQFESFIQVLQATCDNPENIEDANHHIRQLCQGENPVHQYATHLHLITQELNWDESTHCIQLQEGLASSIRDELPRTGSATNLSDLIAKCISLEKKLSDKPDPNSKGASPSEETARAESPPAEDQPMQGTSNRPHLSEVERARRHEGHLCLYCAHPGHFARNCPVKPHRVQQAENIEARR